MKFPGRRVIEIMPGQKKVGRSVAPPGIPQQVIPDLASDSSAWRHFSCSRRSCKAVSHCMC